MQAPAGLWPTSLTRRISAPPDLEPDVKLPPEPKPDPHAAIDARVVEVSSSLGEASVRVLAREMVTPRTTVWKRLDALRRRGLVRSDGKPWAPA